MPYRSDASLWYNLPGVVAAYQPVGAPGPLLARYNQANGGDNRYKATDGVAPTWNGATGWTFNGTTQYLDSGIVPGGQQTWSMLSAVSSGRVASGVIQGTYKFYVWPRSGDRYTTNATRVWGSSGAVPSAPYRYGFAGLSAYYNGVLEASPIPDEADLPFTRTIWIGAIPIDGVYTYGESGKQAALVIYSRILSAAEVWHASRQMAYCHVNPDWSAWGRRRRYYAPMQQFSGLGFSPVGSGVVGRSIRGVI